MRRARLLAIAAVMAVTALAGCTPLYVPPVPSVPQVDDPVRIGHESSLEATHDRLVAGLQVSPVTTPGWLTLQWFDPGLTEVASDSVWLEATEDAVHLRVGLPDHVTLRPGRWRLIVAYRGTVVRQLDAVVPPS